MPRINQDILKKELERTLSPHRYAHTESVVETANKYYKILKINNLLVGEEATDAYAQKIELAAYLHDRCKELSSQEQIDLAKFYGIEIYDEDLASPNVLHARVGAAFVEDKYEICDPVILAAIREHTLGAPDMCLAAKILYLADMLESTRDRNFKKANPGVKSDLDMIRELVENDLDLDRALLMSMNDKLQEVLVKNAPIHPLSVKARNALLQLMQ